MLVRYFALKYAADAACTVLRVDQVIGYQLLATLSSIKYCWFKFWFVHWCSNLPWVNPKQDQLNKVFTDLSTKSCGKEIGNGWCVLFVSPHHTSRFVGEHCQIRWDWMPPSHRNADILNVVHLLWTSEELMLTFPHLPGLGLLLFYAYEYWGVTNFCEVFSKGFGRSGYSLTHVHLFCNKML